LKIVIVSDLQVPFHSPKMVKNVATFIRKFKPDEVICVGDEMDFNTISKFSSGFDEHSKTIGRDRDMCVDVMYDLQITQLSRSNHGARLFNALSTRLPGLIGAPELEIENFLKLPELGIKYHRKPYEIPGTNWVMVHGDEQSIKPHGGLTALEAAKRHGKSVVCGHTHRQGISSYTQSSGGLEVSRLTGFEVGHLMDTRSTGASYMKGTFNWQAGFGVMYIDRKRVLPIAVPIEKDGSFQFEGKVYG
jgi:predicted phosphodiesterase